MLHCRLHKPGSFKEYLRKNKNPKKTRADSTYWLFSPCPPFLSHPNWKGTALTEVHMWTSSRSMCGSTEGEPGASRVTCTPNLGEKPLESWVGGRLANSGVYGARRGMHMCASPEYMRKMAKSQHKWQGRRGQ